MRLFLSITAPLVVCMCGCSESGTDGKTSPSLPVSCRDRLVEIAEGVPAWISNSVFSLKLYRSDEAGVSFGTECSLNRPTSGWGTSGSAGHYCLMEQWLAARTNGFEFMVIRKDREAARWVDETNTILFPYRKGGVTNAFGGWIIVGEFK